MQTVRNNIQTLMPRLNFPAEAQAVLFDAFDRIAADKIASAWFQSLLAQNELNEHCDYRQMLAHVGALGKTLDIHEHTSHMLLFLALGEKLRARYAERGYDEAVYWSSMSDLTYKLEECRLVHGTVGSFVAPWFGGFFNLTRFALGRLQFEIIHTRKEFTVNGTTLPAGSKAINIHIPRTGTRLDHEQVLEAYRLAAEWFADEFKGHPALFTCSSWLLYPWNLEVLAPTSNLAAFYRDFEIVESGDYDDHKEVWRLFDCQYTGDLNALPRDSSFRRAYADRIMQGKPIGWGRGFFLWRENQPHTQERIPLTDFWVASCVPDGGAYRYRLYQNSVTEEMQKIPMPSPMFLTQQGERLWAVLRAPFENSKESGIASYDMETGKQITDTISALGVVGCHITADGDDVYVANYVSGSVFQAPDKLDAHMGHGTDPARQEAPHVHSVFLSPDKKYLLSCDLGLDTVFVYDRQLNLVSTAKTPDGAGARHLVFSKDGNYVYCLNEMSATISVFAYSNGALTYLHDVTAKPEGYNRPGKGSAIKLNAEGTNLYVTERGSETITLYRVKDAELTLVAHFDSHGVEPRDFALLANDTYALCTNQFGNVCSLYRVKPDGTLVYLRAIPLAAPLCVIEQDM